MDAKTRRRVLRTISNGMYVMTSRSGDQPAAATITWLTQCSFEPPLIVAGIRPGTAIEEALRETGRAVVHVLGADQQNVAKDFFSAPDADLGGSSPTLGGHPVEITEQDVILRDAHAWAICQHVESYDTGGDHRLVVLQVIDIGERSEEFEPLTVRSSPWSYGG